MKYLTSSIELRGQVLVAYKSWLLMWMHHSSKGFWQTNFGLLHSSNSVRLKTDQHTWFEKQWHSVDDVQRSRTFYCNGRYLKLLSIQSVEGILWMLPTFSALRTTLSRSLCFLLHICSERATDRKGKSSIKTPGGLYNSFSLNSSSSYEKNALKSHLYDYSMLSRHWSPSFHSSFRGLQVATNSEPYCLFCSGTFESDTCSL